MRVIDAHVHILDASWIPEGTRLSWARAAAGRRRPEGDPVAMLPRVSRGESDPTGERTFAALDRAGVDGVVIPIVDWTIVGLPSAEHLSIRELHQTHRDLAQRWSGRLWYCAGADPRHPDARAILDEAVQDPSCRGLKLYPAAGWDVDDDAHAWIFELARERGLTVVVHTSPLGGEPLETPRSRPAALARMLARYPDVSFVFAHAGFEAWWLEAVDLAAGHWRTAVDLALWQDVAEHDHAEFRRRVAVMLRRLGSHRIMFGSDIIRGDRSDPDGDDLIRWLDQVRALAEPFGGTPPVATQDQVDEILGLAAIEVFQLIPSMMRTTP